MFEQQEEMASNEATSPSPVAKMDIINLVLRAVWNQKGAIMYKDVAGPAGVHPTVASQALSASRDLSLTRLAGKKGLYEFTPEGKEYTRMLTGGRENEARDQLRNLILQNPIWSGIVGFLRTNEGVPREPLHLVVDIERRLGKQWSAIMRYNVSSSIASILEFAGLARIESGKLVSLVKQDTEPGPVVMTTASIKDFAARPRSLPSGFPQSTWPTATDLRRAADRMEPPRQDFAELKDENVMIRVRKDLQSIAYAKGFLDFVENGIRLNEQAKKAADVKNGIEPPTGNEGP